MISRSIKSASIINTLLILYLFISVNDIILIPFGILWLKSLILFILFLWLFVNARIKRVEFNKYLFIVGFLCSVSFFVTVFYGNSLVHAVSEDLALFATFAVPLFVVINYIGNNPKKILRLAHVFMVAILVATVHKIIFVI